jgi:hypothetical protein
MSIARLVLCSLPALLLGIGSAAAQEREWSLDYTDSDAFLVFGTPNTDDVGASFWCRLGSGQVRLSVSGLHGKPPPGKQVTASIEYLGKSLALIATITPDPTTETYQLEATVDVTSTFPGDLQTADYFAVEISDKKLSFPLTDANIGGLLKACKPNQ